MSPLRLPFRHSGRAGRVNLAPRLAAQKESQTTKDAADVREVTSRERDQNLAVRPLYGLLLPCSTREVSPQTNVRILRTNVPWASEAHLLL